MSEATETPTAVVKTKPLEDDIIEAMKDVVDPELGINVVDLGLVYGAQVHDDITVTLDMTLTSAACPLDRRHRGPDPLGAGAARQRRADQLGVDAAVGSGQDHRRRSRAAAGPRLQRLTGRGSRPQGKPGRGRLVLAA